MVDDKLQVFLFFICENACFLNNQNIGGNLSLCKRLVSFYLCGMIADYTILKKS